MLSALLDVLQFQYVPLISHEGALEITWQRKKGAHSFVESIS